jgi:two-component system KDP operon response regulator KdpE
VIRVLVVDDEPAILRAVRAGLTARDYEVVTATSGREALAVITTDAPDVIVLDLGLPDLDGLEVCRSVRAWSEVPIIVLSAESSEHRKVLALDEGADDFVTKPFSMPELLARIRVALRHRSTDRDRAEPDVLVVGPIEVDLPRHRVRVDGSTVDLTPKEFAMLAALARHPGRVLTHRALLHEVWGPGYDTETHYLRVYASQIRRKLGPEAAAMLVAEPGVGYRLSEPDEEA